MGILDKKRFFVFGAARSGRAVARLLARKGYSVALFDDSDAALQDFLATLEDGLRQRIEIVAKDDAVSTLQASDCLVISPGIPLDHNLVAHAHSQGIEVTGELEVAFHFSSSRILGVTGTNGKSTVVSLLGDIFKEAGVDHAVGGNIGTPFAEIVDSDHTPEVMVLEISSFQLDTIREFRSDVAVILNITPDHLDRYGNSFENYVASKSRILNRAGEDAWFVYNNEDPACVRLAADFPGKTMPFSSSKPLEEGVYSQDGAIFRSRDGQVETVLATADFSPVGIHNLENAMAAVAAGTAFDVAKAAMKSALKSYHPLPHRMELVRLLGGVEYINDSKATNVDAAIKSIRSIDNGVVLIIGGLDKDGDFGLLAEHLQNVKTAVLIGAAKDKIGRAFSGHCPIENAETMEEAVRAAERLAVVGDTVLLAPACASFDMFDNYEHRGLAFRSAVNEL